MATVKIPVVRLFVGYSTRPSGTAVAPPEFPPPPGVKDAARAAAYADECRAQFAADAKNLPYAGTFDEVFLVDPQNRDEAQPELTKLRALQFKWSADKGKAAVSSRVAAYLRRYYRGAWPEDGGKPTLRVVFYGFEPRTFLKLLGLECSLPGLGPPLRPEAWYNTSDYVDLGEAVCPREFKGLTLPYALRCRRPAADDAGRHWDELIKNWKGPGVNPHQDVGIAVELAAQLGMMEAAK